MSKVINFPLSAHNRRLCDQFHEDSVDRNAEIFFAVGVGIEDKNLQLFYSHIGGIDRVIDCMEAMLNGLKEGEAKKKKGA